MFAPTTIRITRHCCWNSLAVACIARLFAIFMSQDYNESQGSATVFSTSPPAVEPHAVSPDDLTAREVLRRIEELVEVVVEDLDGSVSPVLTTYHALGAEEVDKPVSKRMHLNQCRSFTSILLVLSFCHSLLQSGRTTTVREVYYYHVTHFRSQKECDAAIAAAAVLLQVPRHALGLKASPRGWFCGDIQLIDDDGAVLVDGRALPSAQGTPISSEWLTNERPFGLHTTAATCVLVIEKEGVYNRLSEDGFCEDYPCIMVTGKGFPDLATRAFVHACHTELDLPVFGLADCDPYGILVLHTYQYSDRAGMDGGSRYAVDMEWLGLRPSHVDRLQTSSTALPPAAFQQLSALDEKRLTNTLLKEEHRWTNYGQDDRRMEELEDMLESGYKVELEALNWLGMDYCADWVGSIFDYRAYIESGGDIEQTWMEII